MNSIDKIVAGFRSLKVFQEYGTYYKDSEIIKAMDDLVEAEEIDIVVLKMRFAEDIAVSKIAETYGVNVQTVHMWFRKWSRLILRQIVRNNESWKESFYKKLYPPEEEMNAELKRHHDIERFTMSNKLRFLCNHYGIKTLGAMTRLIKMYDSGNTRYNLGSLIMKEINDLLEKYPE